MPIKGIHTSTTQVSIQGRFPNPWRPKKTRSKHLPPELLLFWNMATSGTHTTHKAGQSIQGRLSGPRRPKKTRSKHLHTVVVVVVWIMATRGAHTTNKASQHIQGRFPNPRRPKKTRSKHLQPVVVVVWIMATSKRCTHNTKGRSAHSR
jgi:hypothetical protein